MIKRVLIESTSRRLGDTMLGLALAPIIKTKYPYSKITFTCGVNEVNFFRKFKLIDDVILQDMYSNTQSNLNQYEMIISTSFDVDDKWDYERHFGELDTSEGWKKCLAQGNDLSFDFWDENAERISYITDKLEGKKTIGIFVAFPREDMSHSWEFTMWNPEKWTELIRELNNRRDDLQFVLFSGILEDKYLEVKEKNVINAGRMSLIEEATLFQHLDLLVGNSTSITDMLAPLFKLPTVVLHSCDSKGNPVWSGIPDRCCLPNLRYQTFCKSDNEMSFIKPEGGDLFDWDFSHYWLGTTVKRKMRMVNNIEVKVVADEIERRLGGEKGKEWFSKGTPCQDCMLYKQYGKCAYWWGDNLVPELNGKKWR